MALAVVGGVGFTATKVNGADRTVSTRSWGDLQQQKQPSAKGKGSDLSRRLLPVPDGYIPGPDIDEFGNDKVITGKEAVARLKASADDLPAREREARRKAIDKLQLKGLAMRSYTATTYDLVIDTQLSQMQNHSAGRRLKDFQSEFLRVLGGYTKGPKIDGYRNADCFMAPRKSSKKLDMMLCSAYEDDLLVSVTAYGPKPLDTKAVADLLARQLDRISSGGGKQI
ncbi:hypothetical protein [Streptomyces beihaiensis]|uniref:Secreted protein n=1 Tax=Streptomyces beihaiensis TaxID=2984495 RepID=A0ABT3TPZ7_9ACTN|nr:hypothetical protein [Streptomyces beihaiensis]MCX3059108.1 hypothetical protein [Streptomyces beihaiensis]